MEPASWALAGQILTGISAVAGAVGAISDARNQSAIHDYNAQLQEVEAINAERVGAYEAEQLKKRQKQFMATQRAQAGGAGIEMLGAPALIAQESAAEAAMDVMALRYSTTVEAARARAQGAADRMRSRQARQAGWWNAGGTLLTGGTQLAGMLAET